MVFAIQNIFFVPDCFPSHINGNTGMTDGSDPSMYHNNNFYQQKLHHSSASSLSSSSSSSLSSARPTGINNAGGRKPDGYFNTYPIYLQENNNNNDDEKSNTNHPFQSAVHCVGETHSDETAWVYRSCEYSYLCLDPTNHDFFVVKKSSSTNDHEDFQQQQQDHRRADAGGMMLSGAYISTDFVVSRKENNGGTTTTQTTVSTPSTTDQSVKSPTSVALGGINPRWNGTDFNQGMEKVRWSPRVVHTVPSQYYMLDDDVVLVPFHSFAGHNVGHLVWDDFLPIYTLLQIFGLLEKEVYDDVNSEQEKQYQPRRKRVSLYRHLLLRVDTLPVMYASCDIRRKKRIQCAENFEKFLPLMGIDPASFTTVKQVQLTVGDDRMTTIGDGETIRSGNNTNKHNNSNSNSHNKILPPHPICSRHAAAGIGMLTDHGMNDHGWEPQSTYNVHNVGRGPQLYQFRNYMLRNMGLPIKPIPSSISNQPSQPQQSFHIVLNAHSSNDPERDFGLEAQLDVLRKEFPSTKVSLVTLSDYTLQEQIELISQRTNIFISTCGGGSMTGFFLPRGASLILYYAEKSGFNYHKYALTGGPAILDWDLFNNAGYIRTHWLPIGTMNTKEGLDVLTHLIRHEMDVATSRL
jgi:hypothetical protein